MHAWLCVRACVQSPRKLPAWARIIKKRIANAYDKSQLSLEVSLPIITTSHLSVCHCLLLCCYCFLSFVLWCCLLLLDPAPISDFGNKGHHFYVAGGTAVARISYGNSVCPSICPSVCHDPVVGYTKPRWDRDSGSSPYDSLESLVSNEVIWCRWAWRFPSNKGIKEGYPLRNRYFTTIGSSSVKTVAGRHRLAAYHSEHCRRAFQWYQHRWPWTTLYPQTI